MKASRPFDASEYLDTPEMVREYLSVMLEENGIDGLKRALNDVARAKGMTEIANQIGVTRASLYKSLADDGNPRFETIAKIVEALGCKLVVS
jgi:probable addiction module antidote protein